ncbi:Alpha-ketoglutarate-dependent dioxygenase alkB 2 [Rhizophlyctis rosea]|nr:Alpha-ketoglutarate-dependent dioxygenase alkB 2 [Rhizophlyctis rosea]
MMADIAFHDLQRELDYVPRHMLTFSIFGNTFPLPRDKAFYGDVEADGSYPLYRYGGKDYPPVRPWTPVLKILRDHIHEKTGHFCNHVVVNRYLNGNDHIGYHRDKTRDFADNAAVCTLSFGGTRTLTIKYDNIFREEVEIQLGHGSLFILGAATNAEAKHRIKKTARPVDMRISLTFRRIATRVDAEGKVL